MARILAAPAPERKGAAARAGRLMNLAANWGFRYYYRRKGKRMPTWREVRAK